MKTKFVHTVSKGSRFNQIYIPKNMRDIFEVGDIVEVKIIEKKLKLYPSKKFKPLSDFKENIVKELFFILNKFKEIQQIFIVGSFLTKNVDYHDIDILVVINDEIVNENVFEKEIYDKLVSKLQLKYHLIMIKKNQLVELTKKCPLTRSMFFYFISNKPYELTEEIVLDKNYLKFLLMMPEDLLKIKVNSRIFYDNLRRIITIERFLDNKDLNPINIDNDMKNILENSLSNYMMDNEEINDRIINKIRDIIKIKLNSVNKKIYKL